MALVQSLVALIFVSGIASEASQPELCAINQLRFAAEQTKFMHCAVMNSEPVEYCNNCGSEFLSFMGSYEKLMDAYIMKDNKSVSCRALIVDNDRLNLIENIYAYTRNLWNIGYCSDCYDCDMETMPIDCHLTNETIDFNAKFDETSQCISKKYSEPCTACLSSYQKLNGVYDEIRTIKGDKFCFDTRDKMNKTRILWSNQLHCCGHRDSSKMVFYALSLATITVMITFYLGAFAVEKRTERRHFLITSDSLVESTDAVTRIQNDLN